MNYIKQGEFMKNEESITPDGMLFWMESLGAGGITIGEVMLTHWPVGHVEALSDLFYPQPVVSFTYPRI
jgi:carbamoylphosphate synthase small subunit